MMCTEMLTLALNKDNDIKGIQINENNQNIKRVSQFADDASLFIYYSIDEVDDNLGIVSGLQLYLG